MTKKNDFQEFIRFLKQEQCYHRYKFNCYRHRRAFGILPSSNYVNSAFKWSLTKQGWNFWRDISMRWQRYQADITNKNDGNQL